MPKGGYITFDSTPRGRVGWFYKECMKALRGESKFTLCFYPWWWDPEYALAEPKKFKAYDDEVELIKGRGLTPGQIMWRRWKIEEMGPELFRQQYPENPFDCFLFSGASAFLQMKLVDYAEKDGYCKARTETGRLADYPSVTCDLQRVDAEGRPEGSHQAHTGT